MQYDTIPRRRSDLRPSELPVGNPARQRDAWVKWLGEMEFTDFVTVKLNQGFFRTTSTGLKTLVRYTPEDYRGLAQKFQKKISANLLGSAARRFGRVVPVILSLEGGKNDWGQNCGDYHLHLLMKRPAYVGRAHFREAILEFFKHERATKRCALNTAVKIEQIDPQTSDTLASYLSKQGTSGLDPLLTGLPD